MFSYAFATEYPELHGMSGSPVVNAEGRLVGVVHYAQQQYGFRHEGLATSLGFVVR